MNIDDLHTKKKINDIKAAAVQFFNDIESFRKIDNWFSIKLDRRPIYSHVCVYRDDTKHIDLCAYDLEDVLNWNDDLVAKLNNGYMDVKKEAVRLFEQKKSKHPTNYYVVWEKVTDTVWLEKNKKRNVLSTDDRFNKEYYKKWE